MASGGGLASSVQQIQYPVKRFSVPLPLSLFGELEDESSSLEEQPPPVPGKAAAAVVETTSSAPSANWVNGDDDEFGDFEDEFGDFESVPAGSAVTETTNAATEPIQSLHSDFLVAQAGQNGLNHTSKSVEMEGFVADFGSVPAPAPKPKAQSILTAEADLFGNFEADARVPDVEVSHKNRAVVDFFGTFKSPPMPQSTNLDTKKPAEDMHSFFDDFSALSVNGNHVEPSSATANSFEMFEGLGVSPVETVEIKPSVVTNTTLNLFGDSRATTVYDVPKRGSVNGFEDLFGDFEAPPAVTTQSSKSFSNDISENGLEPKPVSNVPNGSVNFDPLGVFQFESKEHADFKDVIFFSPKAQGSGDISDDDWGDFIAPPPPVMPSSTPPSQIVATDPFSVDFKDPFTDEDFGDLGFFEKATPSQEPAAFSGFMDSWETELVESGTGKSTNTVESSTSLEVDTSFETPAKAASVRVFDASSFYNAQVSQFFPVSASSKAQVNGGSSATDSRRTRSVDLDALYASPVVVKTHTRGKSYVEHQAAPLSLSLFGEEEDTAPETAELSMEFTLNDFVGGGKLRSGDNDDEGGGTSSSDSQEDANVDADEFFLTNADDLHKLTLWLLEEGRVQEALACTSHTAALLEFQALQEDCSRAFEAGDLVKASAITTKIEAAHAKLAKPQEWTRWQKRQRHENGFKHGNTPVLPKLTYEDMRSLLGGPSDTRGAYFQSHFQSDKIDSLAKKDLRAAAEHHTRAIETFHLLISATVQEQLLYVKAWSALASSCAAELELGMNFWQRAVQAQAQSHLLTHRQGRNYFAALGQVYAVFLILETTVRLHAPWLEVAGEKGKSVHRLVEECRACWMGSGLKDAVYWALSDVNDTLPATKTSWQDIMDLSIAVNLVSLKNSKAGEQPVCGLSLLPVQTLSAMSSVEWGGRQYFLPLANMWANCVESEPPRLPVMGLQAV